MPSKPHKETAYERKCRIEGIKEVKIDPEKDGRNPDGTFAIGNCANPYGRPVKANTISDILRTKLNKDEFIEIILQRFRDSNSKDASQYGKLLWNYYDGMPKEYKPIDDEYQQKTEFAIWQIERTCFDKQIAVMYSRKQRILVRCPRRSGKTELFARMLLKSARENEKAHCTYFGLTQDRARQLLWQPIIDIAKDKNIALEQDGTRGTLRLENDSIMQFSGNDNIRDREKRQGDRNDIVIIDESQSQQGLKYLIETIMEPTLADRNGTLVIGGSEPRVPDTYFDELWGNGNDSWARFKWTMFDNPFMDNPQAFCAELLKSHGWDENEPTYRREYLGHTVYDDDALVLRFTDKNYYNDADLKAWEDKQPSGDIFVIAGVDIGIVDNDSVCVMLASKSDDTIWSLREEEISGQGSVGLASMISKALAEVMQTRILYETPYIVADTGGLGKKVVHDLINEHHLPVQAAVKQDREASIRIAKDRTHAGTLRIKKDGVLDKACKKLIYLRNDRDQITGEISDAYHSDIFDALIYGLRYVHNRAGALK